MDIKILVKNVKQNFIGHFLLQVQQMLYFPNIVHFLYNSPHYNMDLDITWPCRGFHCFNHGILQRSYRKMTMKFPKKSELEV